MTWRIDETAIFERVAHYFRKPALDEGEREAVRAITSRVAGESEGITPETVIAAIRDAERRAGERLAALLAGRQPTDSEIPEVEVAVLAALDHFAADEAHTTPVLRLAGTHRRLRELEAKLRAPQPAAVRLQVEPPAGPADFTGTELRSPHIRTPLPPPQTPQGHDAGPLIGPALWVQVFRDSHLVPDHPKPSDNPAEREIVERGKREMLVYLDQNRDRLVTAVEILSFEPALHSIEDGFAGVVSWQPGRALVWDYRQTVAHTRAGGVNFLARILDGFVAVSLRQKYSWAFQTGKPLGLEEHYFPLWYSLRGAIDAAESVGGRGGKSLRDYFRSKLNELESSYRNLVGRKPPTYDWKVLAKLPRHKVGIAFLSFRESIENGIAKIPADFPMVRVRPEATLPPTPSPQGRGRVSDGGERKPATVVTWAPSEEQRIREMVEGWARQWGRDPIWTNWAAGVLKAFVMVGRDAQKGDLPGNSIRGSVALITYFICGGLEVFLRAVGDRIVGDHELKGFNEALTKACSELLYLVGTSPQIDEISLAAIVDTFVRAARDKRHVIVTSSHESWYDIAAIASFFRNRGIRFTYKKELNWVPPLNLILWATDMPQMDRVKPTGNPDVDGMARAKAILQVDRVREKRMRDGALNVAFTPGTRSRVGGVGVAKKGDANQAIDGEALVLVLTLLGTGQVKPPSWGRMFTVGAGVNREIHMRAAVIDPRDFPAPDGSLPRAARSARVDDITKAIFETEVSDTIAILKALRVKATSLEEMAKLKKGQQPNAERIQLNEFLDQYAEAFHFLDGRKDRSFAAWCKAKKVAPEFVKELWAWVTGAELDAVYAREKRRLDPKDGTVRGIWTAPLSSTMYSREERMKLGWAYLWPKLKVLGKLLGHVAPFTERGNVAVAEGDKKWIKLGKILANGLGALVRTLGGRRYSIRPQAIAELIPASARLEPIERETIIAVLTAFVGEHNVTTLPPVLAQRIDEVYGAHRETAEAFKAHALEYLQFIVEDTRRTVAVIEKDAPEDDSQVREAQGAVQQQFGQIRWHSEPLDEYLFAAIRDQDEADLILGVGLPDAAQPAFDCLLVAEQELDAIVKRGRLTGQSERQFDHELFQAREKVRLRYEGFSEVAGLGASHETFSSLHLYGRAIPQLYLAHAILRNPHLQCCGLNGEVIPKHRDLHATSGADREAQIGADKKFEEVMRRYLDIPNNARNLQAEFLKIWSARDALLHDPVDFMATIFHRVHPGGGLVARGSPAEGYRQALEKYRHFVLYRSMKGIRTWFGEPTRDDEFAIEQARGALDKAAFALLESDQGLNILDEVLIYLDTERSRMSGLDQALVANAHYMSLRRGWASEERTRNEALLPEIFEYERWKDEQMGKFASREAELIFKSALRMMTAARQSVDGHLEREELIALEDSAFEKAERDFLENIPQLAEELDRLREHLERVADPTKVDEWIATGRSPPNGHKLRLNRLNEAIHVAASQAYRAAARATRLLKGESTDLPPVFSLTATALHHKLTPTMDLDSHRRDGEDFLNGFMGKTALPCVLHGMWMIQQGMPGENLDPIILEWAKRASTEFHLIRVDDRRSGPLLPGVHEVADLAHNGGWYIDYSTSLLLSPDGHPYVLIAKTDLGKKLIVGMAQGVSILAQSLPGDDTPQSGVEALIIGTMTGGFNADYARPGSHVGLFGAITMGVQEEPDPVAILDPTVLLSDKFITAHDLRGLGRQTSVLRGATAVRGTVAPFRGTVSTHTGGHGAGPKPDKPFIARPREMDATIEEVDPLALPLGTSLLKPGEVRHPFTERHVGGIMTSWMRHTMHTGAQARRIRDHKPPPASATPDRPEPPTRPGGRADSPGQRPAGFGELTAGLVRGVPRLDRTGSDEEVVRDEGPEQETGRAVEVMTALAGFVGLADQYAAYRQRGGKVSDLLRLADKVKAWLVSQGIQADKVPLIYLALGAFVIRTGDEPKAAYLKIVASYAASSPTTPAVAVPGVPAWAVPGGLPAQALPVPVH